MMPETTTLPQTVDFLGFLSAQLKGLHGIPTLCNELIQNADDVKDENGNPGASRITFDICDDALYVYNDGVFREIDFERMKKVSWGNKREEVGTTGAFGLGFISVYQITDSPEIYSSGRKWQFVPNGNEVERIRQTLMQTTETKFCLPWAFKESEVRKVLGIMPISRDSLTDFEMLMDRAIESAALFLKQISTLELKRNGRLVRKIHVVRKDNKLLLEDGTRTIDWRILEGSFETSASEMRRRYGGIIEDKRQSTVKVAVPNDPEVSGLLYAFLPSETVTGLPFHINADFYPSPDRKRIIFGDDFRSEWNELAINCASKILADHCDVLLDIFSNQEFWEFVERVKKASTNNGLTPEFSHFWELLKPQIMGRKTVLTSSQKIVSPAEAIFLDTKELINAEKTFENLGMNIVNSDLRSYQNLLLETGVHNLKLIDLYDSFTSNGFDKACDLDQMTEGLSSLDGWEMLWTAIENLWNRSYAYERQQNHSNLRSISIAFGSDGRIWPPEHLLIADQFSQDLFSKFSNVVWYQPKSGNHTFLTGFVPPFTLTDGLELIKKAETDLPKFWKENIISPREIFEWLEEHRSDISSLFAEQIRSLSIWPTSGGELRPLTSLYLAGDFEDPLHLAQLVDVEVLGGGRDFLERVLHVAKLDFITYIRDWVPAVIRQGGMKTPERMKLIRILAENLGKLRDNQSIQRTLAELPIVWCGEDMFLKASSVWFDTEEVKNVLGIKVNLAKLPSERVEAVRDFYNWLGVSSEPKPAHIVSRISKIVEHPPEEKTIKMIGKLIKYIASKWLFWGDNDKEQFAGLKFLEWLPGSKDPSKWFSVSNIYSGYSRHLFESQGNFLDVELAVQRTASDLFKFLNISSEPSPLQVVRHLLFCSKNGAPINPEVYATLNRTPDDPAINSLIGKKCLYLKRPDGKEEYFYPEQVLWDQNPYGSYRYRLPTEYGRFKNFFDRIGVKDTPNYNDAINVLLEISKKFGESNLTLSDDTEDEAVLMYCWKQITEALEEKLLTCEDIQRKLGNQKTIPDSRKVLTQPERMFFEDRPGWGRKFLMVKNNLAPRIEGVWIGMEAAGVRPLSQVIKTEMISCENKTPDTTLLSAYYERINLIQRVIEKHRIQGIKTVNVNEVEKLNFYRADEISIIRIFNGFNRQEESELETVDAILLDRSLYFSAVEDAYPWIGIARELSYVIDPNGELNDLGLVLSHILSQSVSAAREMLDQLGYPIVETIEVTVTEGQTLEPARELEALEGIRVPVNHPDAANQAVGQSNADARSYSPVGSNALSPSSITGRATNSAQEKRKSSRLRSYVYPDGSLALRGEDTLPSNKRTEVGERGVQRVMQYELEQGRTPKDMDKIQVHHPGYDIESTNADGSIRYIEVKAISGTWDSESPAEVTKFEFETARKKGEEFWLYVVEKVDTEEFRIHRIQNPGLRVDYFLFDHGWMTHTDYKK